MKNKPEQTQVSQQEMHDKVNKTMQEDFKLKENPRTKEAIEALNKTQEIIDLIQKDKIDEAKSKLTQLIGELEVLITKDPAASLIPIGINYELRDTIVDIPTAQQVIAEAKEAFEKGYYQVAKTILNGLSSEYVLKISFLPLATYPEAMKLAAALLDESKKEDALAVLLNAFYILAVQEIAIPLPVLRAEEYIKLAAEAMKAQKEDYKAAAILLLTNAEYQLELAEVMGYGKKDKEYKDLAIAIDELKKAIDKENETESLFDKLSEKIKAFKERLFFDKVKEN